MIEFKIAEFARGKFSECAVEVSDRRAISTAAHLVAEFAEQSYLHIEPPRDNRKAIACKLGCNHCCYMRVVATVPEVIAVAHFMALNFSTEAVEGTRGRVMGMNTQGLTDEQWGMAHHSCPLLSDGKCSVYAARPLECRGYNSTDVVACREAANNYLEWDVPMDGVLMSVFKSAQAGLLQALVGAGRSSRLVELTAALRILFQDEFAIQRWLEGENPFVAAELDSSDPEQRAFLPWIPSDELRAAAEAEKVGSRIPTTDVPPPS